MLALFGGFCLLSRASDAVPGRTTDASVEPSEADNFYEAKSRFWVAAGSSEPRGVLVLLSGTDCDARGKVSDPFWQALARREQLGLLGVYFRGEGEPYESAGGGSGAALIKMVEQVAAATGLAHLTRAPLLLVGHSSGAMFAFNFAGWAPPRTAAFVAVKTGPITVNPDPRFTAVPGLFIVGEHDMDGRVRAAAEAFAGVPHPAAWALAVEPGAGHEWTPADSELVEVYLHALLSRPVLSDNGSQRTDGSALAGGWVRNLSNPLAVNPDLAASADKVWLPDSTSASAWERFTKPVHVAELLTQVTPAEVSGPTIEPETLRLEESSVASPVPDEIDGSVVIHVERANPSGCTFNTTDRRLNITAVPLEASRYRLEIRLRTAGLGGGLYRSTVNVIARDQTNARCELPVSLLAWVKSAVRLTPPSLYVGVLKRGETCERTVTIPPASNGTSWKVRSIQSSNPLFATAMLGTVRTEGTTLACRFDAKAALGNQSGYFELALEDGASSPHVKLPFIAFVSKRTSQIQGGATHNQHP